MFTVDSVVPNVWANAIVAGDKTLEEVPNLSNLVAVVTEIVEGVEANV